MNILVAYDGSECADAALDDLRRAGLPSAARAAIVSVTDARLLASSTERLARRHGVETPEAARQLAEQAGARVRATFPAWEVSVEAVTGLPAEVIIGKATESGADLIVLGSQGRSKLGRLILGSVSQEVLAQAPCSVRVARSRREPGEAPPRIIVGVDGSPRAEAAVRAMEARAWPPGTEMRVIAVHDPLRPTIVGKIIPSVAGWTAEVNQAERGQVRELAENAARRLRAEGVAVSPLVKTGDPKAILLDEAEAWAADSIFLGTGEVKGFERFLLGSVSSSVAAQAPCSVEIVRDRLGMAHG
ncbi:MAG TPA: universal stress protein [Blastocatellia bacterium]|nr:universal stress protein [Blastocatellia bacterium]